MATNYTGRDPFTPPAYLAPYGHFISGLAADDGDKDDAAHLMALAMAALDSIQWLAWRTINIVDGGSYNFTPGITIKNAWTFTGVTSVQNFTGLSVNFDTAMHLYGGNTFFVGDTTFGIGHILVDGSGAGAGSDILAQNGADIRVSDAGGNLSVISGAQLFVDAASNSQLRGPTTYVGTSGYSVFREQHIAGSIVAVSYNYTDADVFVLGQITDMLHHVVTLVSPSLAAHGVYRFRVRLEESNTDYTNTSEWQLKFGGVTLVTIGTYQTNSNVSHRRPACVEIEFRQDSGEVSFCVLADFDSTVFLT